MTKPSAAKPPEGLTLFLDRSLGKEPIRTALVAKGCRVEVHDDNFNRDEKDAVWLKETARRGWVVLTKDQRLRYNPLEKDALVSSGARVFILTAGNLRGADIAEAFVRAMPAIRRILQKHKGALVARVARNGRVTIAFPKD